MNPSESSLSLNSCPADKTPPNSQSADKTPPKPKPLSSTEIAAYLHSVSEEPIKIAPSSPLDPLSKKDLSIPKYHRRVLVFDTETTRLMPKHKRGDPFPPDEAYPYVAQLSWIVFNVATNQLEEVVNEYVKLPEKVEFDPESSRVTGITRETVDANGVPLAPLLVRFYAAYMKCDCIVAHNLHFDGEVMRKEYWRNRSAILAITKNQERVNLMTGLFTKKYNSVYCIDMFCTMMNTIDFCGIRFPDANPLAILPVNDLPSFPETPAPCETSGITGTIDAPKLIGDCVVNPGIVQNSLIQNASLDALKPPTMSRKKFPRLNELYTKLFETDPPGNLHNSIIDVIVCLRCFLKVRGATEMTEKYFQRLVGQYSSV